MPSTNFPSGRQIRDSIFKVLSEHANGNESKDLFIKVCSRLEIQNEQLNVLLPNSNRGVFAYRFSWAKSELKKANKISETKSGHITSII